MSPTDNDDGGGAEVDGPRKKLPKTRLAHVTLTMFFMVKVPVAILVTGAPIIIASRPNSRWPILQATTVALLLRMGLKPRFLRKVRMAAAPGSRSFSPTSPMSAVPGSQARMSPAAPGSRGPLMSAARRPF